MVERRKASGSSVDRRDSCVVAAGTESEGDCTSMSVCVLRKILHQVASYEIKSKLNYIRLY